MSNHQKKTQSSRSQNTFRWYVLHTYSGNENRVKIDILKEADRRGIGEYIKEISVPTISLKGFRVGKPVLLEKKMIPGYVLINMAMEDEIWHLIKNTPKVTGFLGDNKIPKPIPESQVKTILEQIEVKEKQVEQSTKYSVGDSVKIEEGPFESFSGIVEEVNENDSKVKVAVTIFGRVTPIELDFDNVKKND